MYLRWNCLAYLSCYLTMLGHSISSTPVCVPCERGHCQCDKCPDDASLQGTLPDAKLGEKSMPGLELGLGLAYNMMLADQVTQQSDTVGIA